MGHSRGEMWWLPWKYHVILERLILTNFILFDTFQPHCWQTSRSASCFGSKFEKLSCLAFPQFSLGSCGAWPCWPLWCLMCPPCGPWASSTPKIDHRNTSDAVSRQRWALETAWSWTGRSKTSNTWNHINMKSHEIIWIHMKSYGFEDGIHGKTVNVHS